ncbi:MAG: inositol monophosphatase family protein [Pseudoxanthomonas sp.]|nr:inositol monophosphatase family protein [Pseudoxanthomonas sp.]
MIKPALSVAVKAARAAGTVILRRMARLDAIPVTEKDRYDFASEVDRQAEGEIIKELRRAFPRHAILAEESGAQGKGDTVWVIDPLDGTHNYLRGIPHFSVSIAQLVRGQAELGVVFDPIRSELFTASRGGGAFLNDRRIRVADRRSLEGALVTTGLPFRQREHLDPQLAMLRSMLVEAGAEDVRRTGSAALDLAYVAAGRCDGYFEPGLKPWDLAAGQLLVREAGGHCTDFTGGDGFMHNGHVVAGNIKVVDAMLACIRPHLTTALR